MIGQTISHYRILDKLGEGGMGVVYKARDTHLDRFVAIKVLLPAKVANPERKRRFVQEAKSASALNHPNIITVYDIDSADGIDFIAMEYVAGKTLGDLIPREGMLVDEALGCSVQMADALATAHEAGIMHRDLKPANIMVSDRGLVKVLDFGLAKLTELPADSTVTLETAPDAIVGTPSYMSPEQVERRKLDTRSDVFSFGAVLYEMLTGHRAFRGPSAIAVMSAILREEPQPPGRELPPELAALITRCLSKDPRDRFQKTAEVKKALQELQRPSREPIEALPSIAVLPFLNMSADAENEYFSDGLTEELINALTQLEGLRVVSRTSVFRFKGATEDICEVGRKLRASTALEGSVRRSGNRLRITAQLMNVADGYHLWSQRYDREMKDIFDVQDELARAIVETLEGKLGGRQKERLVKARAVSPKAYELLLKGRFHFYEYTREGFEKAGEYFEKARMEDPDNALVHAWSALARTTPAIFGWAPPREVMPEAKSEALRALELDDTVADAHLTLAMIRLWYEWDWAGAGREYQRAIELNPSGSTAYAPYAELLAYTGRFDESITQARHAVRLDPVSPETNRMLAQMLWFARRYDEAIEQCHRTLEFNPDYWFAYFVLGLAHQQKGQWEEALKAVDRMRPLAPGEPFCEGGAGLILATAGKRAEAGKIVADLIERRSGAYFPASVISWTYIGLGEIDEVFKWLDVAYEERDGMLCIMKANPASDLFRSDPRFTTLMRKMGLES